MRYGPLVFIGLSLTQAIDHWFSYVSLLHIQLFIGFHMSLSYKQLFVSSYFPEIWTNETEFNPGGTTLRMLWLS